MLSRAGDIDILLSLSIVGILYLVGMIYIVLNRDYGLGFAAKIFTFSFFLRVASAFAIYYFLIYVGGDGYAIADDRAYNRTAIQIAKQIGRGGIGFKEYDSGFVNIGYFNFGGYMYRHFDFDTMAMRMLNAFVGAMSVIFTYFIMHRLFDEQIAKIAAILVAVIPNLVFWSALQVKDPSITFCTMAIIYIMVCKFRESFSILTILSYFGFMYALWFLRKDFCYPLIAVSIVWTILRFSSLGKFFNNQNKSFLIKMIVMSFIVSPILIAAYFLGIGEDFVNGMIKFNAWQETMLEGNTSAGFSRYLRVVSLSDFYKMPVAMAFMAIAPLPTFVFLFDAKEAGNALYAVINLPLIIMLPFVLVGLFKFRSEKMEFIDEILIKWLPLLTWVSITIIYMGVLRYKATLLIYFMMWAAVAWHRRKEYLATILMVYFGAVFGVMAVLPIAKMFR